MMRRWVFAIGTFCELQLYPVVVDICVAVGARPQRVFHRREYEPAVGMFDSERGVNRYVLPGELMNCRCSSRTIFPSLI